MFVVPKQNASLGSPRQVEPRNPCREAAEALNTLWRHCPTTQWPLPLRRRVLELHRRLQADYRARADPVTPQVLPRTLTAAVSSSPAVNLWSPGPPAPTEIPSLDAAALDFDDPPPPYRLLSPPSRRLSNLFWAVSRIPLAEPDPPLAPAAAAPCAPCGSTWREGPRWHPHPPVSSVGYPKDGPASPPRFLPPAKRPKFSSPDCSRSPCAPSPRRFAAP
jgi:hypothetical protein